MSHHINTAVYKNDFADQKKDHRFKTSAQSAKTRRSSFTDKTGPTINRGTGEANSTVRKAHVSSANFGDDKTRTTPIKDYESDLIQRVYGKESESTPAGQMHGQLPTEAIPRHRTELEGATSKKTISPTRPSEPSPSKPPSVHSILESFTPRSKPLEMPKTARASPPFSTLKYNTTRYLPPPGAYYDEMDLSKIFGSEAFSKTPDQCYTCWGPRHLDDTKPCRACFVCGENRHSGKCCPLLYCSEEWYKLRAPSVLETCQIRPSREELDALIGMALFDPSSQKSQFMAPNMLHAHVENFYSKGKPKKVDPNDSLANKKRSRSSPSSLRPLKKTARSELPKPSLGGQMGKREDDILTKTERSESTKIDNACQEEDLQSIQDQQTLEKIQKDRKTFLEEIKHGKLVTIGLGEQCYKEMLKWSMGKNGSTNASYMKKLEEGVMEQTVEKHLFLKEIRELRTENELLRSTTDGDRLDEKGPLL